MDGLEKEAKICESKQRLMPEKREWRSDLPNGGSCASARTAGATQETPSGDEKLTKKCPVHNSISHASEECKKSK